MHAADCIHDYVFAIDVFFSSEITHSIYGGVFYRFYWKKKRRKSRASKRRIRIDCILI